MTVKSEALGWLWRFNGSRGYTGSCMSSNNCNECKENLNGNQMYICFVLLYNTSHFPIYCIIQFLSSLVMVSEKPSSLCQQHLTQSATRSSSLPSTGSGLSSFALWLLTAFIRSRTYRWTWRGPASEPHGLLFQALYKEKRKPRSWKFRL